MNMFVHLYNLHAVQVMGVLNYGILFICNIREIIILIKIILVFVK